MLKDETEKKINKKRYQENYSSKPRLIWQTHNPGHDTWITQ
jgi:hypothetical protein